MIINKNKLEELIGAKIKSDYAERKSDSFDYNKEFQSDLENNLSKFLEGEKESFHPFFKTQCRDGYYINRDTFYAINTTFELLFKKIKELEVEVEMIKGNIEIKEIDKEGLINRDETSDKIILTFKKEDKNVNKE